MKRALLAVVASLSLTLAACPAHAQVQVAGVVDAQPSPRINQEIQIGQVAVIHASAPSYWINSDDATCPEFEGGTILVLPSGNKPRIVRVDAIHFGEAGKKPNGERWYIQIVGSDPTPPTPNPTPDPPPKPTPGPVIPGPGLKVGLIYETADLAKMPAAQRGIISSTNARTYLNRKAPNQWRFFDKDVQPGADDPLGAKIMERKRDSIPWLIISTESDGFEGPLPADETSFLSLLKKYGGE